MKHQTVKCFEKRFSQPEATAATTRIVPDPTETLVEQLLALILRGILTNAKDTLGIPGDSGKDLVYVDRVTRRGKSPGPIGIEETGGWTQIIQLMNGQGRYKTGKLLVDSQLTYGNFISWELTDELGLETEPCEEHWQGVDSTITSRRKTHVYYQGNSESGRVYHDDFFVIDTSCYDVIVGQEWIDRHPEIIPRPRALPVMHRKQLKVAQTQEEERRKKAHNEEKKRIEAQRKV
ncbi:hypothetical protein MMC12_006321 [Toensbergia leucococca]|nr:hypothetical protein [Toensbergia leucococca]